MKFIPIASPTSSLEPHKLSQLLPKMSKEEMTELVADIEKNGLQQSIVLYQGQILDGNHRYWASTAAKKPMHFVGFEGTDTEAQAFVISINIHRRHLTPEKRREIIAGLLKADPTKSNRQIADTAKVDHKTVGAERSRLEVGGEIPHQEKTVGKDGVVQPTKRKGSKPKGKSGSTKGKKEIITYQEVVNASTALNAYGVLEEHLLDALQDVTDKSDFSQAEDCARRTIEKLEERLGQMQPEEKEAA
jgi:ParB-like chromosome segregation protein Spo0J